MYGVRIIETKRSPKTYEMKDEIKNWGYKWVIDLPGRAWVKEFNTLEEAKNEIVRLNGMGFGTDFGWVEGNIFYRGKEAEEKGLPAEERKEIYFFMKENNLI